MKLEPIENICTLPLQFSRSKVPHSTSESFSNALIRSLNAYSTVRRKKDVTYEIVIKPSIQCCRSCHKTNRISKSTIKRFDLLFKEFYSALDVSFCPLPFRKF